MVVSAHWLTNDTFVTCVTTPARSMIFTGFPTSSTKRPTRVPGSPAEAKFATSVVQKAKVGCDRNWGLDHASWAVLRHIYPDADIPVFEMSLDYSFNDWHPKPLQYHYDLAAELGELRDRGVLIIGSGNIVHNLRHIDFENVDAAPYAGRRSSTSR